MSTILELAVALDVEWRLGLLLARSPALSELPIAPLRSVDDLVRLEIALRRFSEIHRSKRSKALIRAVRRTLDAARARLREGGRRRQPRVTHAASPLHNTRQAA
jgi:hypothetical protein